jgi:tungstate transport system permease protein
MDSILQGLNQAFWLIISGDRELLRIILLSLEVSGGALILATLLGLPVAAVMGLKRFPLRGVVVSLLQTGMGLPPVVVGLLLYMLLSRQGPLGLLGLLYSPGAMIVAQTILAFPIVASLAAAAIVAVDPVVKQAALTLGATPRQQTFTVIREAGYGIMAAVIAAGGRVMAEVGAVLMVGGNIAGYTRVMTTTIALETDKGNFELAIALGIILLSLSLVINLLLRAVQQWGKTEAALVSWP